MLFYEICYHFCFLSCFCKYILETSSYQVSLFQRLATKKLWYKTFLKPFFQNDFKLSVLKIKANNYLNVLTKISESYSIEFETIFVYSMVLTCLILIAWTALSLRCLSSSHTWGLSLNITSPDYSALPYYLKEVPVPNWNLYLRP